MNKARVVSVGVALSVLAGVAVNAGASPGRTTRGADQAPSPSPEQRSIAPGAQLIEALAGRDFEGARSLLTPDIAFKAWTPTKGYFELAGADAVMTLLREWYEADSLIEATETDQIVDRHRVGYRIRWTAPEGDAFVFEQQAFYDVTGGRISALQLVCTGDRPLAP